MYGLSWAKLEPFLIIDFGVAVVGFLLSLSWGKQTNMTMDSTTVSFLAKMWAGIFAFGLLMVFLM